ncbi:DUF7507 domain-containing protein [Sphingobacterium pedocola]|uniref:DUF7507 domain-containing protein n=1 Tax=Sphingobacterium pedocola TaxID=2082722 RepID=A0ABR9T1V1_9SPHI|nr:gliding motility-associated C-terminal domain-containing protein [Sphingobacterium pedocola]MBE8719310.1 hypothetical protein [Sphingobacterium pedocola]
MKYESQYISPYRRPSYGMGWLVAFLLAILSIGTAAAAPVANPAVQLTKSTNRATSYNKPGQVIEYTISITNTGTVPLYNVQLTDSKADVAIVGNIATFPVGDRRTFISVYTLTQEDIDHGAVYGQATAQARDAGGTLLSVLSIDPGPLDPAQPGTPPVDPRCPTCTVVPLVQQRQLDLVKTSDRSKAYATVGDKIPYTIRLTNSGNVTLHDVVLSDPGADQPAVGTVPTLAVGASRQFTATHTVTQADLDRGAVYNQATAQGQDQKGTGVTALSRDGSPLAPSDPLRDPACLDCTVTRMQRSPGLAVVHTTDRSNAVQQAGQVIAYTISVTNTGNITLYDVRGSGLRTSEGSLLGLAQLAVGERKTISATYTVTQADIDRGVTYQQTLIRAKDAKGIEISGRSVDVDPVGPSHPYYDPGCTGCTVVASLQRPALQLRLTTDRSATYRAVGEVVQYSLVLRNTGNVSLYQVGVTGQQTDVVAIGSTPTLAVGQEISFTTWHTLTQADVDRGAVYVLARALAKDLQGRDLQATSKDDPAAPPPGIPVDPICVDCTIVPVIQQAAMRVVKRTDRDQVYTHAGEVVEYSITVTNTGTVTLFDINLLDANADQAQVGTIPQLGVGQVRTFRAAHTITQGDMDAGIIYNQAMAQGKDTKGQTVRASSTDPDPGSDPDPFCTGCTIITTVQRGAVELLLRGDRSKVFTQVGEKVSYTLTVQNTGNVTLTDVRLDLGTADGVSATAFPQLSVGLTETVTFSQVITQEDIDRGAVYKRVSATAKDAKGIAMSATSSDPNPLGPLDPHVDPACPACTVVPVQQRALLDFRMSGNRSSSYDAVGDELHFSVTLTNSGNVTLTDVVLQDAVGQQAVPLAVPTLLAGDTYTASLTHLLSQADLDRGAVYKQLRATALDPKAKAIQALSRDSDPLLPNDPLIDPNCLACVVVPVSQIRQLEVFKTPDRSQYYSKEGEQITYTITVKNTGNVSLHQVNVRDTNADQPAVGAFANLAVGQTETLQAIHSITQADVNRGVVYNIAAVTALDPQSRSVQASSTDPAPLDPADPNTPIADASCPACTITPIGRMVQLDVRKTANRSKIYRQEGDVIEYTLTVTNTGKVTLSNLILSDPNADQTTVGTVATLAVGQTRTFMPTHTVTQADLDRGVVYNQAHVTGLEPKGTQIAASSVDGAPLDSSDPLYDPACPDCTISPMLQQARVHVVQTADRTPVYKQVGDVIPYAITVTNNGNVTLHDVQLRDVATGQEIGTPIAQLAVGQSEVRNSTHTVTQADLDRGAVYKQAVAQGYTPQDALAEGLSRDGDPLSALHPLLDPGCLDCTVSPLQQLPGMSLRKTVDRAIDYHQVGQPITYTLTLTNTGNVTLHNLQLSDPNADQQAVADITTLAVGEARTFTAVHTITQADIDRGVVYNQAQAIGQDANQQALRQLSYDGDPLDASHPLFDPACPYCTVTPIQQVDQLQLIKVSDRSKRYSQVGHVIPYTITVTNSGNRAVDYILVTDANADQTHVGSVAQLAVGQSQSFTAMHTVTQADLDRGAVYNQAVARGRNPDAQQIEGYSKDANPLDPSDPLFDTNCPDCTVTPMEQLAQLTLLKRADRTRIYKVVGDVIEYRITIANTGTVSLRDVVLTDDNADQPAVGTVASLAVGQTRTFFARHTIDQADVDRGAVYNIAEGRGIDPRGREVEAVSSDADPLDPSDPDTPDPDPDCPSCTVTPIQQDGAMDLLKTADLTQKYRYVGEKIRYEIRIRNIGNVTLQGVVITDDNADVPRVGQIDAFEVGASHTFYAEHTITREDMMRGYVANLAKAVGSDPIGRPVYAESSSGNPVDPDGPRDPDCPSCTITPLPWKTIEAVDDAFATINGGAGGTTASVLQNDLLQGVAVVASDVDLQWSDAAPARFILHADGTITVPANTPMGDYTIQYTVCERQNPDNCATATACLTVEAAIRAEDDYFSITGQREGTSTASVLDNDSYDGRAIDLQHVTLHPGDASDPALRMEADGTLFVAAGTKTGTYTYSYRICEVLNPLNCDEAIATIVLDASELFIPNIVTPNDDGKNDYFEVIGHEAYDRMTLVVTNRWGNDVYRNENYDNRWGGSALSNGTYFYILELIKDGQIQRYTGWVIIKKY